MPPVKTDRWQPTDDVVSFGDPRNLPAVHMLSPTVLPSVRRSILVACGVLSTVAMLAFTSFAQTIKPGSTKSEVPSRVKSKPLRLNVEMVQIPVIVVDEQQRPVLNLQKDNFSLFEDGKLQDIEFVSNQDSPISVGLILDFSKSMVSKVGNQIEAVIKFFENSHPDDDYFAIKFSDNPELIADVTQSIGSIQSKLSTAVPEGYTALLDSVYLGIEKLRSARYQRKALLIISDGDDNASRYTLRETKNMAQEADVTIYAISLNEAPVLWRTFEEALERNVLKTITEATGGRTVTIHNAVQLPKAAAAISWELRNQYVIEYRSTNHARDGKWRKVLLRARRNDGTPLRVSYKRGYYSSDE